jgi:hypothetical protein|tara:strand:- start:1471 stop:1740 length:270 start_codon:yes stop_codon:yes gene_type:complete
MGQFSGLVEKHRKKLAAEEWAKGVKTIHCHRLKSMWYDTRPQDTDEHHVTDIEYNDGVVERRLPSGEVVHFGEKLSGADLVDEYIRNAQ